jgi:2-phosphosulfolactate phosphatase
MGEVGGRLIPGFDHNTSPSGLIGRKLSGRAVQRTGSGTQGVVNAVKADSIWLGSLVVAAATARALTGRDVTLVAMGAPPAEPGEDDDACARYLEALLLTRTPPRDEVVAAVRNSAGARMHSADDPDRPIADIDCCVDIDRFDFAMKVERGIARRFSAAARP